MNEHSFNVQNIENSSYLTFIFDFFLNIQHMGRQNWIWKWCKVKTLAVHDYKIPTGRIALVRINTTVLQSDRRSKGNKSIR